MKIGLKSVKSNFAGFISAINHLIGAKLKEPEIRNLFDAVSMANGDGGIDTDLPDSSETFSKAIQRERKFCLNVLQSSDKN